MSVTDGRSVFTRDETDGLTEEAAVRPPRRRGTAGIALFSVVAIASVVLALVMLFVPLERQVVGVLAIALTVMMMMAGVHVAVAMAVPALLGAWKLGGTSAVVFMLEEVPRGAVASWTMSVIPLFILMGLVVVQTGMATVLFDAAKQWIGRLPGGLGVGTIVAGAGLSSASGSTLSVTYATARLAVPEMLSAGYSPRMAAGTVTVAGMLKMLIPPSIAVVIYSGIAGTPVGPQLLAGLVPGLLLALLFTVTIVIRAKLNPTLAPAVDMSEYTWGTRVRALGRAWPLLLLMTIIVGGVLSGVVTPTESGALAALAAIVIGGWLSRRKGLKAFVVNIARALAQTVAATAVIMLLIVCVHFVTTFTAMSGVVQQLSVFVTGLGLSRTAFLLLLIVMFLILGMLMDELSLMLLTVPILLPILAEFDVSFIWFGVFLLLLCEIGMVTPPVGMLSFVVHGIVKDPAVNLGHNISLMDIFRGTFWFVMVAIGLIVFLIFVPDLALWLPSLMAD